MQTTSLFAYEEILETLPKRREEVLNALETRNNFTNKELADYLGWEINRVTPRVNELVKLGLVEEKVRRTCKGTGRTAIAWGIKTDKKIYYF